jgi:hypothetical protein
LIGNVSFVNIPWQLLIIIFYGIYTLGNGINHLTIFFSHLVDPILTDSLLKNSSQNSIMKGERWLLKSYFTCQEFLVD